MKLRQEPKSENAMRNLFDCLKRKTGCPPQAVCLALRIARMVIIIKMILQVVFWQAELRAVHNIVPAIADAKIEFWCWMKLLVALVGMSVVLTCLSVAISWMMHNVCPLFQACADARPKGKQGE